MLASWRRHSRRRVCLAGLVLALASTLPSSLAASVVVPATLDELAGEADLIVHARIVRVDTRQAPRTLRVERVVSLEILRPLKGSPEGTVVIVLPGGTHGRYRTVVHGVPEIAEGEEALFFLRASPGGGPQLVGLSQGFLRVRIDPATGQRMVIPPIAAGIDGPVVRGATDRGPQPLARIESRIASVVLAQVRGRR
jgi:hypothetical protein